MLQKKLGELEQKSADCSAREKALLSQLNSGSAGMKAEEIKKLDSERRECVALRRSLRGKMAKVRAAMKKLDGIDLDELVGEDK